MASVKPTEEEMKRLNEMSALLYVQGIDAYEYARRFNARQLLFGRGLLQYGSDERITLDHPSWRDHVGFQPPPVT
jgi:hypothetical protein